jgi:hypothetical protein
MKRIIHVDMKFAYPEPSPTQLFRNSFLLVHRIHGLGPSSEADGLD